MKTTLRIVALILMALMSLSLAACQLDANIDVNNNGAAQNGANGKDGIVPHIGENGNWWIGDSDTGVKAVGVDGKNGIDGINGEDGAAGKDGENGSNGINGENGYDVAQRYGFTGTYEEWCQLMACSSTSLTEALKNSTGYEEMVKEILAQSAFLVVTNHGIQPDTGEDLSTKIQNIVNNYPNKTIFFPDGEYIVSKPITTSEKPDKTVSIKLANYAVLKAADNWTGGAEEAVVMLGDPPYRVETNNNNYGATNDISRPGTNFFFEGGTVDGNGKANGITIEKGRETRVENVNIINTVIGFYIKDGVNNVSSDADILNLNIVGNGASDSIGLKCIGYDNTFDNIRISGVKTGVRMDGGGNFLRSIYVENTLAKSSYSGSVGITEVNGSGNWYLYCSATQFETAYNIKNGSDSLYDGCSAIWTDGSFGAETAFKSGTNFKATIKSPMIIFADNSTTSNNAILKGATSGSGLIEYMLTDESKSGNTTYKKYLVNYTYVGGN